MKDGATDQQTKYWKIDQWAVFILVLTNVDSKLICINLNLIITQT